MASMNIDFEKQKVLNKLETLSNELKLIEKEYEIDLSELKSKTNNSIKNIKEEKFSMAFFGAFSDGKSTILSALTNRLDIEISPKPTTDKIKVYEFKDYQIIDTPGLFSENLIHDDLTKQYISEANVILYTVDPVNPLKESHLKTIKWILKDLNKIDSTIFVINKMDEIADLEDDEDFNRNSEIKKEVILDTLKDFDIVDTIKIVAISADPFGQGLEFWRENLDEYKKLSRIENLDKIISNFVTGYKDELILKTGISVIKDTIIQLRDEFEEVKKSLGLEVETLNNQITEYRNRLEILDKDIDRSYLNIKNELIEFREEILIDIDAAHELKDLGEIVQKKIGQEGYILQEKINSIIQQYTKNLLIESKKTLDSLEETLNYHLNIENELIGSLSPTAKLFVNQIFSSSTRTIADNVLKVRDFLGVSYKFKPWGALKVAKFLKGIPVIIDVLDGGFKIWAQKKFENKRNELKQEIEKIFKDIIQNMTFEKYVETYFPDISEIRSILFSIESNRNEIYKTIENIHKINRNLDSLLEI